jgi:hypothetical protein
VLRSPARRKLASNTSEAVLFSYSAEEGWRRIAYVDESFRFILDSALENRADWRMGMTKSRLDFIVELRARDRPEDWALIIGELDKVPYQQLRDMDIDMSFEDLRAKLWSNEGYPYQAILALLLGLSGTPEARREIEEHLTRVEDWNWANNLGAYAAAYIELEGVDGLKNLEEAFLLDPSQPLDKLEQIVMALSVHNGLEDLEIRTAVHAALERLLANRPEAGAIVARQFSLRSDWSQVSLLEPLIRNRQATSVSDMLTISVYLGRAREAALLEAISDG